MSDITALQRRTLDVFVLILEQLSILKTNISGSTGAGVSLGMIRLTGDDVTTDFDAPADLDIAGDILFALNPYEIEVSAALVGETNKIIFTTAPITGDFPLVVYTKIAT